MLYYFSAGFYFFSLGEPIHVCLPCVVPLITARAPADWTATESTNGQRIVESMGRHFAAWLPYAGIVNGTHRITGRERTWRSALRRLLRPLSKMGTDWPDNRPMHSPSAGLPKRKTLDPHKRGCVERSAVPGRITVRRIALSAETGHRQTSLAPDSKPTRPMAQSLQGAS